jgi:hypothetical protein
MHLFNVHVGQDLCNLKILCWNVFTFDHKWCTKGRLQYCQCYEQRNGKEVQRQFFP